MSDDDCVTRRFQISKFEQAGRVGSGACDVAHNELV